MADAARIREPSHIQKYEPSRLECSKEAERSMARLSDFAGLVDGQLLGDGDILILDALPIRDAKPGCITLVDSEQNAKRFNESTAAAAIVTAAIDSKKPQIVVTDLHAAFRKIAEQFRSHGMEIPSGISDRAIVDAKAQIGKEVYVGPGACIAADVVISDRCRIHANVTLMQGVEIGEGCEIFPNTVLYPGVKLGEQVVLHAGCVIGADGFGYYQSNGRHEKSAQLGWVEIHDHVEVGANTTIDRGTYGATVIGEGSKLDNLVQIGHNVHVGRHNLICSQVGIAGSASTGEHVVMGGQVGVADHTHLNDRAMVGAQSGVMREVDEGDVVFGSPAIPRKNKLQEVILTGKLPEMSKELKKLRRIVDELQSQLEESPMQTNAGRSPSTKAA